MMLKLLVIAGALAAGTVHAAAGPVIGTGQGSFADLSSSTTGGTSYWYDGEANQASLYVPADFTSPVAAIPEPETYAMLLAGLALLGFAARRRNLKAARTA